MAQSSLSYIINKDDVIISTDKGFADFAYENDSPGLETIVDHKKLWSFFSDDILKSLYKSIFNGVRTSNKAVEINFRCDSPEVLRFMKMDVKPLDSHRLEVSTNTVREINRAQALKREIFYIGIHQGLPMCGHCNKLYIHAIDKWLEVSEALEQSYLIDNISLGQKTCESCLQALKEVNDSISNTSSD